MSFTSKVRCEICDATQPVTVLTSQLHVHVGQVREARGKPHPLLVSIHPGCTHLLLLLLPLTDCTVTVKLLHVHQLETPAPHFCCHSVL